MVPLPTSPRRRLLRFGVAGLAVAGLVLAPAGPAWAQLSSTTVTPPGHEFTASLASGVSSDFTINNNLTTSCDVSETSGQVPDEPDNHNPAGPVSTVVAPPSFTAVGGDPCDTNIFATEAEVETNDDNGDWEFAVQFDQAGSTGTLTIPQAGAVVQTSGLASCTITVAPDEPASVTGDLIPGTATSLPQLDLSAGVPVPIEVTGGSFCPTAADEAVFEAVYVIADTTDPNQQFTVGP